MNPTQNLQIFCIDDKFVVLGSTKIPFFSFGITNRGLSVSKEVLYFGTSYHGGGFDSISPLVVCPNAR